MAHELRFDKFRYATWVAPATATTRIQGGKMPEQQGIKYDQGKPRLGEMLIDFSDSLTLVAQVWAFGADKYAKSNWKHVGNGIDRYTNAMLRHLIKEGPDCTATDDESELMHAAHVAWNALARLHLIMEKQGEKGE